MPVTVVLAIGFDPWFFETQKAAWRSSGHFVTSEGNAGDAIHQFREGDFDAVLLGRALPPRTKEQIISQIRASGSSVPILCLAETGSRCEACEFATTSSEPGTLMQRIEELLAAPSQEIGAQDKNVGVTPPIAAVHTRLTDVSRSGVRRRAPRPQNGLADGNLMPRFTGADSPCFSIRMDASTKAEAGVEKGKLNYSRA